MSEKRVVFHTGFMKTGTTYLQRSVFPGLADTTIHGLFDDFMQDADEVRRASSIAPHEAKIRRWRDVIARDEGLDLFTWEGMVGSYLKNHCDFSQLTDYLRAIAPDAHVLLIIRRQDALLESLYKQCIQQGHSVSPASFLNWKDGGFGPFRFPGSANIAISTLDFERFVSAYEAAFGPGNVHVVPYEWLRAEPDRFYAALSRCVGQPVQPVAGTGGQNVSLSRSGARVARVVNRLYRMPHREGGLIPYRPFAGAISRREPGPGKTALLLADLPFNPRGLLQRIMPGKGASARIFDDDVTKAIMQVHAAANRRLDDRLGLGLGSLGYY